MEKFVEHCEANEAPVSHVLRAHLAIAMHRIVAPLGVAESEVNFTTASTSDILLLGDFQHSTPPEAEGR